MKSSFGWFTCFATVGPATLCLAETLHSSSWAPTARFASSRSKDRSFGEVLPAIQHSNSPVTTAMDCIMDLRGGASKRQSTSSKTVTGKKKVRGSKTKALSGIFDFLKTMPSFTKHYLYATVFITLIGSVIGEERAHVAFSLDPFRLFYGFEIWRPLTAACFIGAPSMQWAMLPYNLWQYGSQLESDYGGAQFLVFMASQLFILVLLATLLGQPFLCQAAVTGMLYVVSRLKPNEDFDWIIATIPYWSLPFANAFTDFLQSRGSFGVLIPHIMGILAGHFYYYQKMIWPVTEGGEDWLLAPDFMVEFVNGKTASKIAVNKALKTKKRKNSRGRTLGSALAA